MPNKGAALNTGGRRQFPIPKPLAARVGELGRWAYMEATT
jgi:hypothetical protein